MYLETEASLLFFSLPHWLLWAFPIGERRVGLMEEVSDLMDKCLGMFPALLSQQK